MEETTLRERIVEVLEKSSRPLTAREIAVLVGLEPQQAEDLVYECISHIAKTLWRKSGGRRRVYMVPPRCKDCGYVFTSLDKPRRPSKCPRCKSQRIEPPRFYIGEA